VLLQNISTIEHQLLLSGVGQRLIDDKEGVSQFPPITHISNDGDDSSNDRLLLIISRVNSSDLYFINQSLGGSCSGSLTSINSSFSGSLLICF
jgi:hypothetical protein